MKGERIFLAALFFVLMAACAYGAYSIANMIVSGIVAQNWFLVIGGGILAYFFLGILIIGFIVSLALFLFALTTK